MNTRRVFDAIPAPPRRLLLVSTLHATCFMLHHVRASASNPRHTLSSNPSSRPPTQPHSTSPPNNTNAPSTRNTNTSITIPHYHNTCTRIPRTATMANQNPALPNEILVQITADAYPMTYNIGDLNNYKLMSTHKTKPLLVGPFSGTVIYRYAL